MVMKRYSNVDFYKGNAMLLVILVHSKLIYGNLPQCFIILNLGQIGVQMFFFISGVLMVGSYNRVKDIKKFYVKKIKNIYPLWFLAIVGYSLIYYVVDRIGIREPIGTIYSYMGMIVNALLLNGLIPAFNNNIVPGGWFIGTLFILYLLTPALCCLLESVKRKVRILIPILLSIFSLLLSCLLVASGIETGNNSFYFFSFFNQAPCYILGIVYNFESCLNCKNATSGWQRFFSFIILTFCIVIGFFYSESWFFSIFPLLAGIWSWIIFEGFQTELLHIRKKIRVYKMLSALGRISYECYLCHIFFTVYVQGTIYKIIKHFIASVNESIIFWPALVVDVVLIYFTAKILHSLKHLIMKRR